MNHVDRAGGVCLLAALLFCVAGNKAHSEVFPAEQPEMFRKQPIVLAQLLNPPAEDDDDSPAPGDTPAPADTDAAAPSEADDTFVFAGDLARQLRMIDPDARVDWTGTKLVIEANGKEFAVFPTGEEMVIDGDIERGLPSLTIRNGEIYVPKSVIGRIGQELERSTLQEDTETTTLVVEAPLTADETPETTTSSSILPDLTPAIATPTPRTGSTESTLFPDSTPAATTTPSPTASPSPTRTTTTPAPSEVTPFPQATPTPTPKPTPTPTPSPTPTKAEEQTAEERRDATLSTESFKAALRDRVSVSTQDLAVFNMSQLDEMADQRSITRIIVHPDESGLEREDRYGNESAKISLEIARRLQTHLEGNNIEVVLTRDDEDAVTIGNAMETITKSGAQLLVVVSVGYSTTFQDLGGFRVFYMNDSVDYNSLEQRTFDANEVVPAELNYKPFQNLSKVLASSVTNSISASLDNRNPIGTNPAPHYLVRRAPMAAAAVVVGYLSNPSDAQRLTDTEEQDAMARALAEGIQNYATQVSQGKADDGGNQ